MGLTIELSLTPADDLDVFALLAAVPLSDLAADPPDPAVSDSVVVPSVSVYGCRLDLMGYLFPCLQVFPAPVH